MILVDMSQIMIASVMAQVAGKKATATIDEDLVRHITLNVVRANNVKYRKDYGQMVLCFDSGNIWRKDIFPYYKARRHVDRQASPIDWDTMFATMKVIKNDLQEYFPYKVIQVERAEADDIIGTLAFAFASTNNPTMILSGDKDFQQLQLIHTVSQVNPISKAKLVCVDPTRFLVEHIIKGDSSDGIPNIYSADDCFVTKTRQTILTTKRHDQALDVVTLRNNGKTTWTREEATLLSRYDRNEKLINLLNVPTAMQTEIKQQYVDQKPDRSKLYSYFVKNKLVNLLESIGEF